MSHLSTMLGQSGVGQAALWMGVMIALLVGAAIGLYTLRKRLTSTDEGAKQSQGLTLHDLRTLRSKGQLSDEEFEVAKRAILGAARFESQSSLKPNSGKGPRRAE